MAWQIDMHAHPLLFRSCNVFLAPQKLAKSDMCNYRLFDAVSFWAPPTSAVLFSDMQRSMTAYMGTGVSMTQTLLRFWATEQALFSVLCARLLSLLQQASLMNLCCPRWH